MLSIPVSPVPSMSRRVPLSNIQNNALSPYSTKTAIPAKRPAKPSRDILGPPPAKKAHIDDVYQAVEQKENRLTTPSKIRLIPKTPSRNDAIAKREAVHSRAARTKVNVTSRHPPPVFQHDKIDIQARKRQSQAQLQKQSKDKNAIPADVEQVKQWQRHYRKIFPASTFYLDESVAIEKQEELRHKLLDVGSTIMTSFSITAVTHVITDRGDVPPEFSKEQSNTGSGTINPKLLDASLKGQSQSVLVKMNVYDDHRDILVLARNHGKKIWTSEKLERMITALHESFDEETLAAAAAQASTATTAPTKTLPSKLQRLAANAAKEEAAAAARLKREEEGLDLLLRQEKLKGSQQLPNMYYFKGPFVMVGDATGRYRPFIVREYTTVKAPEEGEWPQFRSNREGRCPFVLDPDTKRAYQRDAEKEAEVKAAKEKQKENNPAKLSAMEPPPRGRSLKATTSTSNEASNAKTSGERKPLNSLENKMDRDMATAAAATAVKKTGDRLEKLKQTQRARQDLRIIRGYEPVASGMRTTGPTSAVVSQTISSNTAAVGAKAGTSRDVQKLNRRVFEKTNVGIRQTATTTLQVVGEDTRLEVKTERKNLKRTRSEMVAKEVKKVAQAGYCENCRDKYDDFDEHIVSKRHVKFAANDSNFLELDALLSTLKRPRKDGRRDGFVRTPSY
ncbi:hypothetical protein ABW19_dt0202234 [Dactylella cylindrospora]|nr:hypothetical protein ABW19_dt0202234 [Dactylella cylindrospora]